MFMFFGICHFDRQRFLEPGEKLVATAMVKKRKNLMTKKLQLLLIDKPRLIYVDPVKLVVVGEIPWSRQLQVKVENQFKWKIVVVNASSPFSASCF